MIKHIVLIKLKDNAKGMTKNELTDKIKKMLNELPSKIKEIKLYEVGINFKQSERNYDLSLISGFESKQDLENYILNPEHLKVVEFINEVKEDSKSCDYEV